MIEVTPNADFVIKKRFLPGSKKKFQCKDLTKQLVGPQEFYCLDDGSWNNRINDTRCGIHWIKFEDMSHLNFFNFFSMWHAHRINLCRTAQQLWGSQFICPNIRTAKLRNSSCSWSLPYPDRSNVSMPRTDHENEWNRNTNMPEHRMERQYAHLLYRYLIIFLKREIAKNITSPTYYDRFGWECIVVRGIGCRNLFRDDVSRNNYFSLLLV